MSVVNANGVTAATFTYDGFDRVATKTDSEGYTVAYSYDNADRLTKITYPDGTADAYAYDRLDLAAYTNRAGQTWTYAHDANRRLTVMTDPRRQQTLYGYNGIDELTSLTDAKGAATHWTYDVEGRLAVKQYADNTTLTYTYDHDEPPEIGPGCAGPDQAVLRDFAMNSVLRSPIYLPSFQRPLTSYGALKAEYMSKLPARLHALQVFRRMTLDGDRALLLFHSTPVANRIQPD